MRALRTKLRRSIELNGKQDTRYTKLIIQLKDLENLNKIHAHYLDWLRSNWSQVRLPTLFSEIFDIPISSKSSTSSAIGSQDESLQDDSSSVNDDIDEPLGDELAAGTHELNDNNGIELKMLRQQTASRAAIIAGAPATSIINQEGEEEAEDFFFSLTRFQDTDDKIDAADLNPTVDCLDSIIDH